MRFGAVEFTQVVIYGAKVQVRRVIVWLKLDGAVKCLDSLINAAEFAAGVAEVAPGLREVRAEVDGALVDGDALRPVPQAVMGVAEVVPCLGIVGVERYGFVVELDGVCVAALPIAHHAQEVVADGIRRSVHDQIAGDGLRAGEFFCFEEQGQGLGRGGGEVRLDLQGVAKAADGADGVASCLVGHAQIIMIEGDGGVEQDGLGEARFCLSEVVVLQGKDAGQVDGVAVVGLDR